MKDKLICGKCGVEVTIKTMFKHKCNKFRLFFFEKWITWPMILIVFIGADIVDLWSMKWYFELIGATILWITAYIVQAIINTILKRWSHWMWNLRGWYIVNKLHLSCILWDLRGLKTCEKHGFHSQSWINGKCKKCEGKK